MNAILEICDCSIICGHRGEQHQNEAFRTGMSHLQWPDGWHNKTPSMAVDVLPYPIDWNDARRNTLFAGLVLGVAAEQRVDLTWGGDWNKDWQVKDNNFQDLAHFELTNGG